MVLRFLFTTGRVQGFRYIAFFKHRYRSVLKNIASQPKRSSVKVNVIAIPFSENIAMIYRSLDAKPLKYQKFKLASYFLKKGL